MGRCVTEIQQRQPWRWLRWERFPQLARARQRQLTLLTLLWSRLLFRRDSPVHTVPGGTVLPPVTAVPPASSMRLGRHRATV